MNTISTTTGLSPLIYKRAGAEAPVAAGLRALIAKRLGIAGAPVDLPTLNSGNGRGHGPVLPTVTRAHEALTTLQGLLDRLREKLESAGTDKSPDTQGEIDGLIAEIDDAAGGCYGAGDDVKWGVYDLAPQVRNLTVFNANLEPGETVKASIDVKTSAQRAGLFISLKDGLLDVNEGGEPFVIEVRGREGNKQLTFSKDTTAEEMAKAINDAAGKTGVRARVSAGGVRLESRYAGSAEFVTVKVINDGGLGDDAGRIHRLMEDDSSAAEMSWGMTFDSVIAGMSIKDRGQDADVWVNGEKAMVYGAQVYFASDKFSAIFSLSMADEAGDSPSGQQLGEFHGFTLRAEGKSLGSGDAGTAPPINDQPGPGPADQAIPAGFGGAGADLLGNIVPPADDDRIPGALDSMTGTPGDPGGGGRPAPDEDPLTVETARARTLVEHLLREVQGRTGVLSLLEQMGIDAIPATLQPLFGGPVAGIASDPAATAASLRAAVLSAPGGLGAPNRDTVYRLLSTMAE